MDDTSSKSSESQDLAMVGVGGRLREWGSQPNEPPGAGDGGASFLSNHWLDLLEDVAGPSSESSSGVAGAGESVEDEEEE